MIHLHSARRYRAYALGFTPGFCYLASLAPPLVMPRKARPRIKVPAGAVAIAEQQTAVYQVLVLAVGTFWDKRHKLCLVSLMANLLR